MKFSLYRLGTRRATNTSKFNAVPSKFCHKNHVQLCTPSGDRTERTHQIPFSALIGKLSTKFCFSCCWLLLLLRATLQLHPNSSSTPDDVSDLLSFHLFLMPVFFHSVLLVLFTLLRTYHLVTWKGWEKCPPLLVLRLVRELVGGPGSPRTYHRM